MPNWCEGNLKIRGKKKKIIDFMQNNLVEVNWYNFSNEREEKTIKLKLDDDRIEIESVTKERYLYFKDSRRLFPIGKINIWLGDNEEREQIVYFSVKQAWHFDVDYFKKISEESEVDLRIVGYERGMEFSHEIEVIKGHVVKDKVNEYKGNEWYWEVDDPSLGG